MDLISVFHMGARDTFGFAFREGEGPQDIKDIEGKTILLGSAAWQSISDPRLAARASNLDHRVCRGRLADLGHRAGRRARRRRAVLEEGLRAGGSRPGSTSNTGWGSSTRRSRPTPSSSAARTTRIRRSGRSWSSNLRGWAMGLEFGYQNPRAAVEMVFEQFPTLASNVGPELGTTSILQQINVFRGDMDQREGWGWHDMESWQAFLRRAARDRPDFRAGPGGTC